MPDTTTQDRPHVWLVPGPRFGLRFLPFPRGATPDQMAEAIQRLRREAGHAKDERPKT